MTAMTTRCLTARAANPQLIADQLDQRGFVCLERAVASEWLVSARSEIKRLLRDHGQSYHFFRNPRGQEHRAIEAFVNDPETLGLLAEVMRARLPEGLPELANASLRVIAGPRGDDDSFTFHYDAGAVTMVVPLFLPEADRGRRGELIGFFNKRPFRRSVSVNLLDKLVDQSGMYRRYILRRSDHAKTTMIDMELGNAYLFWGYRTLHANLPCEPGALRATLLIHFGRPHGPSRMLSAAAKVQRGIRSTVGTHPKPSKP